MKHASAWATALLLGGCYGSPQRPGNEVNVSSGAEGFVPRPEDPAWRADRNRNYEAAATGTGAAGVIPREVLLRAQAESLVATGGVPRPDDPGIRPELRARLQERGVTQTSLGGGPVRAPDASSAPEEDAR